jgi:hypothetical protein
MPAGSAAERRNEEQPQELFEEAGSLGAPDIG